MISLIVAASTNHVIGAEGALPWHLSADLKRFKTLTMGKPIVMGRRTHESIGGALPGRQNIVITRQANYRADGCDVVQSIEAAVEAAGDVEEIMVIGGGDIYQQFLPRAERIYLTRVQIDVDGDTYFLPLKEQAWRESARETHSADESNDHSFAFTTFERIK